MDKLINIIFEKLSLSSPINFLLVLVFCVLTVGFLSDVITMASFHLRFPDMMEMYLHEGIREQIFINTILIAIPSLTLLLYLIQHISKMREQLAQKLKYDALTGLLTREAFLGDFKKHNIKKNNDAFLIVDADLFKNINDTHGHIAGDHALIAITKALKKGIRKTDAIGRIGGEEFAVHLKDVNYDLAIEIAERLRENVKKANQSFKLEGVDLSVSIGAVIYKEEIDLPILMTKADRLLYKAKENGRNRVEHNWINNTAAA